MSNFYLDIDGPTSMDRYLQVKHEDTASNEAVLSVASILEREDSRVEAEKIVKRYNAYEDLIGLIEALYEDRMEGGVDASMTVDRLIRLANEIVSQHNIDLDRETVHQ